MKRATETFTCEACGESFESGWSDAEARADGEARFGVDAEQLEAGAAAVVCSDCLRQMLEVFPEMERGHPEYTPPPPPRR